MHNTWNVVVIEGELSDEAAAYSMLLQRLQ